MARQLRLVIPNVAMHIVQRGNDRMACFSHDTDRLLYLAFLRHLAPLHACSVHSYCLMSNHIHLLVTPAVADGPSRLMHDLSHRYSQFFNRKYKRTGTLWEGRYRACLVQSPEYVLGCYRYIELNPVRAGVVSDPTAFLWSSHAVNIGLRSDSLITQHADLRSFGVSEYRTLFSDAISARLLGRIREATNGGYPLADESFLASLATTSERKLTPGRAGRPKDQKSVPDPDL
jgi:REP-associated tyrosine transposase